MLKRADFENQLFSISQNRLFYKSIIISNNLCRYQNLEKRVEYDKRDKSKHKKI